MPHKYNFRQLDYPKPKKRKKRPSYYRQQDKGKLSKSYRPRAHQITRKEWEERLNAQSGKIGLELSGEEIPLAKSGGSRFNAVND